TSEAGSFDLGAPFLLLGLRVAFFLVPGASDPEDAPSGVDAARAGGALTSNSKPAAASGAHPNPPDAGRLTTTRIPRGNLLQNMIFRAAACPAGARLISLAMQGGVG